ncbi:MAG: Biotin carboxylase of acetyl-CoA carboxylase [Ktedonobacterales bacterium]|jgi:3-methylcrotonyl-CoA carboxylase alpha subunit|nr:MAG: Biotin carboxylase of acetyl-CoA carboxylase [Ktedonobacterales bacterium]
MFKSVLIANRGEIAVRVMAACQEMGIRAIAVYSEADRDAAHVRAADEAYCIGPAPARESYLNISAILAVAQAHGAEAIHPGYGFLSENAEFAEACARAGIVFIGPPAEAIRLMGSKTAAKRAVEAAGVPTVPGYAGEKRDAHTMRREAARIGYPVLIKAAAGGGGKGMRAVHAKEVFDEALAAAQREALAAFGDDSVFLEKLVVGPRHVEFQILADQHGNCIHLGERDCSIQRRHQKVVEESPSVALTPGLRAEMGAAAVRAAQAAGYVNAGTCEFLLDRDGRYYFLEMNTRLQVEHPVTELVTGLDLVRLQLQIAAGEPLALVQEHIAPRGHAIEVRLYAEDPANGYLPSTGTVLAFAPLRAPGVRVDAGIAAGDEVTVHYDPMLAKLIVYAPDRPAAVERLAWALERFAVLGVATNIPLLRAIADEPDFRAGDVTTAYLETHDLSAATQPPETSPNALAAAALWETQTAAPAQAAHGPYNPWTSRAALGTNTARRFRYRRNGQDHSVSLIPATTGDSYEVEIDDQPYPGENGDPVAATTHPDGQIILALGVGASGARETAHVARRGNDVLVSLRGGSYTLEKPRPLDVESASHESESASGRQTLTAPMAGTIIQVNVAEGDTVEAHRTLVVLGAMKMEHAITAPYAGRVVRVTHVAGDVVPGGEPLVELDGSATTEE